MDMRQGTLYLSFDGQLIGTYQEATPGVLTQVTLPSEWSSYDSYDCVTASQIGSVSFSYSPPCSPPGQTITFSPTATFGSSPYTFSWNFGDGSSATSSSSTSHTYIATGSYTVTVTATDAAALVRTSTATITISNLNGPGLYALRDDFGYTSLSSMTTAGWAVCNAQSQVSVGGGLLSLTNDGSTVGNVCWNNIPAGVTSWTVMDRGQYTKVLGGLSSSKGGIWLSLTTAKHTYELDLDGYYQSYYLWRDGVKVKIVSGYTAQLGTWHDLALDMRNGVLSALVDGKVITTYTEVAGTNNSLTSITMRPGWETVTNYDWVSVAQVSDIQPAGFMIGFSQISVSAKTGTNAITTINLSSLAGFTGTVSLAIQPSPATGLTCTLNPSSVSLNSFATSTMTCTGAVGTYTVTVTGTSGSISFTTSATITITT
jgi:PKD repeat protein